MSCDLLESRIPYPVSLTRNPVPRSQKKKKSLTRLSGSANTGCAMKFLTDFRPRDVSSNSWFYGFFSCAAIESLVAGLIYADVPFFLLTVAFAALAKYDHTQLPLKQ